MNRRSICIGLLLALLVLNGCAAPGSAIGSLKIQGSLVSDSDNPIPNEEIEFMLPAAYGLGGLDLVMNSPEDFGHTDHRFKVTTDQDGNFEADLGERVYHMTFWLLPPLGGFPKRPPAPFLFVRFSENDTEYYAVQTHDGRFKIYNYSGKELPLSESELGGLSAFNIEGSHPEYRETVGVIKLKVKTE